MYGTNQKRTALNERKVVPRILFLLLLVHSVSYGEEFTAKVVAVLDGDTVLVKRVRGLVKVRMAGIDAPEKAQPFGASSRRSLSEMIMGKQVTIQSQAIDKYGRMVASINVNDLDVSAEQLRRGMAWENSNFHSDKKLLALQEEAKQAPRGLWALSNPVPPWEWRKRHPSIAPVVPAKPSAVSKSIASLNSRCGTKKYCSEMVNCEEAKFYLDNCDAKFLDGDSDGLPCEVLCAPQVKIKR